jgi:hypothetical protein
MDIPLLRNTTGPSSTGRRRDLRRVAEKLGMTREKDITKWGKRLCLYAIAQS